MGKVFKALSKSESEQPRHSLAAVVVAEEEARAARNNGAHKDQEAAETFDFLRFSLNAPATEAFDSDAAGGAMRRDAAISPAREVTLDAARIDPHLVAFYEFDPRA